MASLVAYVYQLITKSRGGAYIDKEEKRIWGKITRDLLKVFDKYEDGKDRLPISKLRPACNELGLYPSNSQVFEMVQCAVEYGSPCEPDHITFGEFCVLVTELQNHYVKLSKPPLPKSLYRGRANTGTSESKRWKRRESLPNFEVFLGGSCNPTMWRQDIAIPFFKQHEITFYNPVQNWRPELMELEAQAKQNAEVLFFVMDNVTRAIASMIETAYLVACGRQVVVVICDYTDKKVVQINGDNLSGSHELNDLCRSRKILIDLIERNSVPVFKCMETALKCTDVVLKQNLNVQELSVDHGAQPVLHGYLKVGESLLQMREAFNSIDNTKAGTLSTDDIRLAYKSCTGHELDGKWLRQNGSNTSGQYSFEEFCCIITEYQRKEGSFADKVVNSVRWFIDKLSTNSPTELHDEGETRDIYLGGSCGECNWRDKIAIPLLRKHGLSYFNPCGNDWEQRLIPIQVAAREKCRLLLYVITDKTTSISSMIEAGYYIGYGCRVVVCVQNLPDGAVIAGEKISEHGLKDYNRGRAYLTDLASREGVQLFDNIEEAVTCAISFVTDSV